jgi:hypothetical protein
LPIFEHRVDAGRRALLGRSASSALVDADDAAAAAEPTQRLPSWAPTSACTGPAGSGSFELSVAHETNCEPSKRRSPVGVPSQRYPSASWLTAKTSPGGNPFSEDHTDIA